MRPFRVREDAPAPRCWPRAPRGRCIRETGSSARADPGIVLRVTKARPKKAVRPKAPGSPKAAAPTSRATRSSRDVDVVCELTCEDPKAILELADDLGRLAGDLWFDGKLDNLPSDDDERDP
jgi:hypothetical protein